MSIVPAMDLQEGDAPAINGLPASHEAELELLGCLLYDNAGVERITDALRGEHFFEPTHGRLFTAIERAVSQGCVAQPITLHEQFAHDSAYLTLGGLQFLADLVLRAPPVSHAPDLAETILDLAQRRALIRVAHDTALAADKDRDLSARDHIEAAEQQLFALAEHKASSGFESFATLLAGAVDLAASAFQRDGGLSGISTGLKDLDQKIGGLHPSDLLILAGRPSMGKTALATNIAFHVASHYAYEQQPDGSRRTVDGGVVGFFSLEMSGEQLAFRILAEVSGVSGDRIRKGEIDASEFGRIREAAMQIQDAPLYVDATGGISIAKLAARARRLKRQHGLDLLVIDYLQLATGSRAYKGGERVQEVSEITQGLKALAKELSVPVIALSQLSRQVEQREDKRPQLSDLRESGSIEQDADMVMFVYREEYYLERAEPKPDSSAYDKWRTELDAARGVAEVIVGKQRHGPVGTVRLAFNGDTTKFGNLAYGFAGTRNPYGADH